jgi:nucleoside-diphosphate-sugar epimerase
MRILVAGATGVLGRVTLPHLKRHDVLGLTQTRGKLPLLRALGAEGVVCDVYDSPELIRLAQERRPHVVVNFVTDLSTGSSEANNRARREGGKNLVSAAEAAGSRRLILESVAFPLERPAAEALEEMEQTALESPLEVLILRSAACGDRRLSTRSRPSLQRSTPTRPAPEQQPSSPPVQPGPMSSLRQPPAG